jgi:hypothetical protein
VRAALLAVFVAGCALCHAPPPTPVPAGVEATAFIDQTTECWTIELRPEAKLVAQLLVSVLSMTLGQGDGESWESR